MSQLGSNNGPVTAITEMPELEQVYSLINGMYQQNDLKESASKWLEALQKSVFGWHIADQLLIQARDFESSYFAAQTLKTKIQYNFEELPANSYDDLKNSIVAHLAKFDEKIIQTQLGLCVTFMCTLMFFNLLVFNFLIISCFTQFSEMPTGKTR